MAHFAKIDSNNTILAVLTVNNVDIQNENKVEEENIGQVYLETHNNWPANQWIQTSYNTFQNEHLKGGIPFRGNYAIIGGTWDPENNIFWPIKPYNSWVKNIVKAKWESPIGDAPDLTTDQKNDPNNNWHYVWNESTEQWNLETYLEPI
jgi:hypothetical protein